MIDLQNATAIGIDIETIPSEVGAITEYVKSKVSHPASMKKEETIEKWEKEQRPQAEEDALAKCSFDGAFNHIICISVKSIQEGDNGRVFYTDNPLQGEKELLQAFFDYLEETYGNYSHEFVGHNIVGFDLQIIKQRAMVLGVKIPSLLRSALNDKWGDRVFDTMLQWSRDRQNMASQDKLCLAFNIEPNCTGLDGSMVWDCFKQGEHEEIKAYCMQDTITALEIYKRMKGIELC